MARPAFGVTEKNQRMVKTLAAMGCRQEDIAQMIGITPKTLRKHFASELHLGAVEANAEVMQTLFQMARSGKNTAASIFWAKTRCGLREHRGAGGAAKDAPGSASQIVVHIDE